MIKPTSTAILCTNS